MVSVAMNIQRGLFCNKSKPNEIIWPRDCFTAAAVGILPTDTRASDVRLAT
jgi:hypothetical protein